MQDWIPKCEAAEIHLTYRCDLSCIGCDRLCYLPPTTPDMTLKDAEDFVAQATELNWHPKMHLLGGEPTLHKDLYGFIDIFSQLSPGNVYVVSHWHGSHAQKIMEHIENRGLAKTQPWGRKPDGSVVHDVLDCCIAPLDYGEEREPCWKHAEREGSCGISVDACGYTVCSSGGAIDGILQLGIRTKRLADLWDREFAYNQTKKLCNVCGRCLGIKNGGTKTIYGVPMTQTWSQAIERILYWP